MNAELIFRLVGLRYKLLWAQTRTRNGRIVLFLAGYVTALLVLLLLAQGGFGAAIVAVRSGKAETVARAVLGGLFLNAAFISLATGFGINSAFTDEALRRFAINARGRLAARHLTGLMEPIWILVLGLYLGLSTGLYVYSAGGFWLGAAAALLLIIADYLLARTFATLLEWLAKVRGGTVVLALMLFVIGILPGLVAPKLARTHGVKEAAFAVFEFTPPFAAATMMVNPSAARLFSSLGVLAVWIVGMLVALAAIERQSAKPRSAAAAAVTWKNGYDQVAALFGDSMAPLMGRSLRYYLRSNRVRMNLAFAIPVLALVSLNNVTPGDPRHKFVICLGAFAMAGFMGTAVMCTNQFGYDASGFRRYFLLPVSPSAVLRAASYPAVMLGGTVLAISLVLWMLLAGVPWDWRMGPMLLGSALTGLFIFNSLGLWTSLLWPRAVPFGTTFGNQLSLAANLVIILGVMVTLGGSALLDHKVAPDVVLSWWWISIPATVVAISAYVFSLRQGALILWRQKERLLNTLEGRN